MKLKILLALTTLAGVTLGPVLAYRTLTYNKEQVIVTDAERVCKTADDCKYLVFTDKKTYENRDDLWSRKFNSSDLHGKLKGNKGCWVLEDNGVRFAPFSWYPNIIKAKQCEIEENL